MNDALLILMRWLHISSVVVLIGGVIYGRLVLAPALAPLADQARKETWDRIAAAFRGWIMAAVAGLLASGLYNLLQKTNPPAGYHMVFGIKMLLALHVFAVGFLLGKPGVEEAKRTRWMTGILFSGLAVITISAYLRWMSR